MKRLFTVNGEHFATKQEAKVARGEPIKPAHEEVNEYGHKKMIPATYKYRVEKGPDHIGTHGWHSPACNHNAPQAMQPKREGPRVRRAKR